jgi:hypothetical protein
MMWLSVSYLFSGNHFGTGGAKFLAEPLGKLLSLKILDLAGKIVVVLVGFLGEF